MFGDMEFWREKIHMRQDLSAQIINTFHRLTAVSAGNSPVCAYTLNAKDQRTSSSLADGSSWAYGYDSRSQLASAVKSVPGVPDESFGYLYDDIGNQNVGTVTDSYAYGPFGQCAAAGTTSNPFRFSCEYLDTATRLVCYYYCECGRDSKRLFLSGP